MSTLSDDSVLDLAVDGAKLLVQDLLGLVDETSDAVLNILNKGTGLVAALSEDLRVIRRATAVPGEELESSQ